jgi:MFS family permease
MAAAVINPAFVPLGKAFKITTVEASYELTVYIIFAGVGPLLISPLANVYGRRPVYLLGNILAAVTNIIAGHCTTWNGILVTRVFNGIGAGSNVVIGGATICDLYFLHERGLYMGIYTFFLTNGPHLAPLIGGYIAQNLGWRQCFNIPVSEGTFSILSNQILTKSGVHPTRNLPCNPSLTPRNSVLPQHHHHLQLLLQTSILHLPPSLSPRSSLRP